jgi:hypothetical protein
MASFSRRSFTNRALVLALLSSVTLALGATTASAQQVDGIGINDLIESVDVVDGQLEATTVDGQRRVLNLSARPVPGRPCPILNLALGPIELDLLGLVVETSPICLDVTAVPGSGNLLGNLLCSVARLLDRGVALDNVLARLNPVERMRFLNAIRDLLNGVLNQLNNAVVVGSQTNSCTILDLALGPLELNLLGLLVELDDCAGGPVTVTVTAEPGAGNLLGNLLCGILGGIDLGETLQGLLQRVLRGILDALP